MKKIIFEKGFIEHFKVKVTNKENGDIEIDIDSDFMVYLNDIGVMAAARFNRNKSGTPNDETLSLKDILVDQLQYVDYLQKIPCGKKELSAIEMKFKKQKGKKHT